MKKWSLLQRQPEPQWTLKRRIGLWAWNLGLLLIGFVGIGIVSLLLAPGSYPLDFCNGYWESPLLLLLNILPVVALGLVLYGVTGRSHWAFPLTAALVLGLSVASYFKIAFRDDPLMMGDLLLLREAGSMLGSYTPYWDTSMKLTVLVAVAGTVLLWLAAKGRPPVRLRLGFSLGGLVILLSMIPAMLSDSLYDKTSNYTYVESQWSSTQQYIAHGFIYPFLHSFTDTVELAPDGYRETDAEALLSRYTDADIPEDQKVNIVCIMLEANNDFTRFGTPELATDVYAVWHQLEQEGFSGNLVTNIFAGGTIDTERCFLTGYSNWLNYRGQTNSYVWYFRQQGYTVTGMHPCNQWFYDRQNINSNLGFETYYFMENYFSNLTDWPTAGDNIFFPALLQEYQAATADGTPYFNFSVTYQGHGPYSGTEFYWGDPSDFAVDNGEYTSEEYYILANYFASIANTNENLGVFTDYLRTDDEPVILVLFGDHNPWLGDGNSVYDAIGLEFDMDSQEGFLDYYSTRYIIWANDAAKKVLNNDFQGTGPDIGPYFLMNQLFALCGWEGPAYMQAIAAVAQEVPVVHTSGYYMEDGTVVTSLSDRGASLVNDYLNLQYYWRNHFAYGKD